MRHQTIETTGRPLPVSMLASWEDSVPREDPAPLSVLHVVAPGRFGGLEAVVQALVIGSRSVRVDARVTAVLPRGAVDHPFLVPLEEAGIEVFPLVVSAREYLSERAGVGRICQKLRPDVVHTHGYRPDVLDAGVARKLGIPVVTTVHGFTGGDWKNRWYEWLQRRALRRFDAIVAVSGRIAAELSRSGIPVDRVHLVRNGWRPAAAPLDRAAARHALEERTDDPRIGWVGRLSHEKGPDVFLEALARLRGRRWTACVLGSGPARQALERRATALGLRDRVHWHGPVAEAGRLYRAFDIFVLSSRTEGTPIVLFEAMESEVPLVAALVGGVVDVVSATEARLVPPEDPAALAAAVAEVLDNPAAARARARAARQRLALEFGSDAWVRRYEAIYRAVLRPRPAGRAA